MKRRMKRRRRRRKGKRRRRRRRRKGKRRRRRRRKGKRRRGRRDVESPLWWKGSACLKTPLGWSMSQGVNRRRQLTMEEWKRTAKGVPQAISECLKHLIDTHPHTLQSFTN